MKKLFLLFTFFMSASILICFGQNTLKLAGRNWEGNQWSFNANSGAWYPQLNLLANFSIDDFSWGQVRTKTVISAGETIQITAQILENSGGTNGDMGYFGVGDQWISYAGHSMGIRFINGKVHFFDTQTAFDTIGTFKVGEIITFSMKYNTNGSLTVNGPTFSGTFTPSTLITNPKWIMTSANNSRGQGFYIKNISTRALNEANWEGGWWNVNSYRGSWFPTIDSLWNFSIDDFSWGQVRSQTPAIGGETIILTAQILENSGGTNGDMGYFGVGDQWISYVGHSMGIRFINGKVHFFDTQTAFDTIGTYKVGEIITFSMTYNSNGSITVSGPTFSGTFTPSTIISNPRWMFASANNADGQGFYMKNGSVITDTRENSNLVTSAELFQNYPNPFNPSTTFKFKLTEGGLTELKVYDILGNEVASILKEYKSAGTHNIEWNAVSLPSGTYFSRLTIGSQTIVKKISLLK